MWVSLKRCCLCVRDKGNGLLSVSGVTGFSGHKTNRLLVLLQDAVCDGLHVFLPLWDSAPLFIWPLSQSYSEQSNNCFSANIFDATLRKRDLVCFSKTKPWRWPGSPGIVVVSRGYRARALARSSTLWEAQKHCARKNMSGSWQNMCHFFWFLAVIRIPARDSSLWQEAWSQLPAHTFGLKVSI